jgi:hypothetical protein
LRLINPVLTPPSHFLNIHFNIIVSFICLLIQFQNTYLFTDN